MSLKIISESDTRVTYEVDPLIGRLSPFYKDEQFSDRSITVVPMTQFEVDVLPERVISNAILGGEYDNKIPFGEIHLRLEQKNEFNTYYELMVRQRGKPFGDVRDREHEESLLGKMKAFARTRCRRDRCRVFFMCASRW